MAVTVSQARVAVLLGVACAVVKLAGSSPPAPPQPFRLRLASKARENMAAKKLLDPTFLPFDIREALRIDLQDRYANHMP